MSVLLALLSFAVLIGWGARLRVLRRRRDPWSRMEVSLARLADAYIDVTLTFGEALMPAVRAFAQWCNDNAEAIQAYAAALEEEADGG